MVLGLEDTLAAMSTSPLEEYDAELPVVDRGITLGSVFVKLRPYLYEFLEYIAPQYEIIVFCNGSPLYCKPILDFLEKDRTYFAHRIYDSHVLFENPSYAVKYYDFLISKDRSLDNLVAVEAHVQTFALLMACGVPIEPFGSMKKEDEELVKLGKYLDELADVESINMKIKDTVNSTLAG